jgi:MinD superfamily P-loop ATPase
MRLAIASGKGGTGKTTLAVNLAMKAKEKQSCLLVDLDVEEPNGGIFVQGDLVAEHEARRAIPDWDAAACTLCGKCPSWCLYNALIKLGDTILVMPNLCHSCYACSEMCPASALAMKPDSLGTITHRRFEGLDFVESRLEIGLEQASPLISQSLAYIDEHLEKHDLQILDSPPGTACAMVSAVKQADFVILISEPTPFGLHDLKLAVQTVRELGIPFGAVINRDGIGNDEIYGYLKEEKIPLLAKIPHQRRIAELYSQGAMLYKEIAEIDEALEDILSYIGRLR